MNIKKKSKIVFIVLLGLMLIGTFFDWQIDTLLVGKFQLFGHLFEIIGLWPLTVVRLFCLVMLIRIINFDKLILTRICQFILSIWTIKIVASGAITTLVMVTYQLSGEYSGIGPTQILACYLFGIIITIIAIDIIFKIDRQTLTPLLKRIIMVFALTYIINHEVTFIKNHAGRARYYAVEAGLGAYTPWFVNNANAVSNDFMSFISGHTAIGLMAILPVFFTNNNQLKLRQNLYIFGLVFGSLTALSRMVLSQHYLTDTVGAMIVSFITIYIVCKLLKIDIDGSDLA